jgi:hypothetical protein
MQHAEGGVTERVDALGVKVLLQHTAKHLPNLIEGEPLPDNHDMPRDSVAVGQIRLSGRVAESSRRHRKDVPTAAALRFFSESPLRPSDSFMSLGQ